VAALVGAEPSEIIFNSCGTEATNTAILSALAIDPDRRHIITSAVEHSATVKLCEHLATRGYEISWLPVDKEGLLDPAKLSEAITSDTAVISLLWANNETGVLFPVEKIAAIALEKKVPLHLDAVQTAGKVPIDLSKLNVQYVSLSAHKLYAPRGSARSTSTNGPATPRCCVGAKRRAAAAGRRTSPRSWPSAKPPNSR